MNQSTDLVTTLRAFGEMPFEGGSVDPVIDVMNSLAHQAADEIERLRVELQRFKGWRDPEPVRFYCAACLREIKPEVIAKITLRTIPLKGFLIVPRGMNLL